MMRFLRLIDFLIRGQWMRLSDEDERALRQQIPKWKP